MRDQLQFLFRRKKRFHEVSILSPDGLRFNLQLVRRNSHRNDQRMERAVEQRSMYRVGSTKLGGQLLAATCGTVRLLNGEWEQEIAKPSAGIAGKNWGLLRLVIVQPWWYRFEIWSEMSAAYMHAVDQIRGCKPRGRSIRRADRPSWCQILPYRQFSFCSNAEV